MPYGIYLSAAGADAQAQRMEVISNNIANADTAGFKAEMAVLRARHAEDIELGNAQAGDGSVPNVGGGVFMEETVTNFAPGALKTTGVPTDMAIDGDAFFVVKRDREEFLTRAGDFTFNNRGELLTAQGHAVLSENGTPVTIDPTRHWQLEEGGVIAQEGRRTHLMLRKPASLGDLVHAGENMFRPLARTKAVAPEERRVESGMLEMSSVNPTTAMLDMITTSRAYEANVHMIQSQDHMLGALVTRVLGQS